jgi:hypothetical protein
MKNKQENKSKVISLPKDMLKVYENYKYTPYYMNIGSAKLKKYVYVGKGTPDEINKMLYKLTGNKKISNKERMEILKKNHIGIDCSGFIANILDARTMKKYNTHIWKMIKKSTINPIKLFKYKVRPSSTKLNAATLTSDINTIEINNIKNIKVGDLIKLNGGKHIAIISKIEYSKDKIHKIYYLQSTERVGVMEGWIKIKDETKSLDFQIWQKIKNAQYQPYSLYRRKINSNGIRRLKFNIK